MDDIRVLQMVQQYLHERGFSETLATLQAESGTKFEDDEFGQGGQLCSILYEYEDLKATFEGTNPEGEARERRAAEEELLSMPLVPSFPSHLETTVEALHAGNIIACRINSDGTLIATGGADRAIKIVSCDTYKELRAITAHSAPILSLAWCPTDSGVLLSTAMDGKVLLSDARTGETLLALADHTKYVTRSAWSPGGDLFATCGRDQAVIIYRRAAAAGGGDGDDAAAGGGAERGRFECLVRRDFAGTPEALCFLADNETLVVSVRDDNYLHYLNVHSGITQKVNMNQTGDDHVSFTALDLVASPDGRYLLVATDKSRLILYPAGSSMQLRNYYGATNDQLGQTRACWHPSGAYIYCTSQDLKVFCWAVGSQRVAAQLKGHGGVVRDVGMSPDGRTLVSGSFDKTLRVWRAPA